MKTATRCPECGGAVPVAAIGRPRRFCSEGCAREWARVDKAFAREAASLELELEDLRRKADAPRLPRWAQWWILEQEERDRVRLRLTIASLEYELMKVLAARREHGWRGAA